MVRIKMVKPASKDRNELSDDNTPASPSDHIMEEEPNTSVETMADAARDTPRPPTPIQRPTPRVPAGGLFQSGAPHQYPQGRPPSAAPSQYPQVPSQDARFWRAPHGMAAPKSQQYSTASYAHGYGYGSADGYDSPAFVGRDPRQYPDMERSLQSARMDTPMESRAPSGPAVSPTSDVSGRLAALERSNLRVVNNQVEMIVAFTNLTKQLRRLGLPAPGKGQDAQEDDKSLVLLPKKRERREGPEGDAAGAAKRAKRASRRDILNFDGTAKAFLDFLKKMDCNSDEDLARVANVVEGDVSLEYRLSSESSMPRVYYYLKVGGNLSTHICANPEWDVAQPEADKDMAINLALLELTVEERQVNPAAAHGDATTNNNGIIAPPKFVMPLGEVYMVNRSHRKTQMVTSTNFFVVMDITSPKKSLWMVYRENRPFERRDGDIEWDSVSLIGTTSFFKGGKRYFDIVRLVDDITDWNNHEDEMVAMQHVAEVLSREGTAYRKPDVVLPVFSVLKRAVKQGWEAGVKVEEEDEAMGLAA